MKGMFNKSKLGIIAIAVACVMLGAVVTTAVQSNDAIAETQVITSPFTQAVEDVHESVVGVNNYGYISQNSMSDFSFGFGFNFEVPNDTPSREVLLSSGSGVVVADEGYILTNYHVVKDATHLEVVVNGDNYDATLMGYDAIKDIAVIQAEDLKTAPIEMGDSDVLQVGDWAICIGNPMSFTNTTTVGVISALNREIKTSEEYDKYGKRIENINLMIQTDAAINSGNSGGGLFNTQGELMGIPTLKYAGSIYSSNAPVDGIGMAIPINEAKPILEKVLNGETVENDTIAESNGSVATEDKPRIGVTITDVNSNSAAVQQGIIPQGAYITKIEKDSPAEKAGLMKGDIIVDIEDQVIKSAQEMVDLLSDKNAGDTIKLKAYRVENIEEYTSLDEIPDGEYIDYEIKLEMINNVKQ